MYLSKLANEGSELHAWLADMVSRIDESAMAAIPKPEDKVEHAMGIEGCDRIELLPSEAMEKSAEVAKKLREEGNALFKESKNFQARLAYTRSLRACPVDYDNPERNEDFAIVLANRSAALEGEGHYIACEQDIRMAFKYGYPRKLHYKV